MSSAQLYDTIGATYTVTRRTEQRIAARIWAALGDARTVLNVGAGTGSYEPPDRHVLAVEPSALMRSQRPVDAAPCLAGFAESLPFDDQSFDAAMAFSTVHHWQDPIAGLREMRRVARRVVVFTFDASDPSQFWLTRDYLPEFADLLAGRPSVTEQARAIGARMEPALIHDDSGRWSRAEDRRRLRRTARAIATRWLSPPDSSSGNRVARSARPSRCSTSSAAAWAALTRTPSSSSGNATFSTAVSAGSRLKSWKT